MLFIVIELVGFKVVVVVGVTEKRFLVSCQPSHSGFFFGFVSSKSGYTFLKKIRKITIGFRKVVALSGYYSKKRPTTDRQPLFDDTKPKKNPEWEKSKYHAVCYYAAGLDKREGLLLTDVFIFRLQM